MARRRYKTMRQNRYDWLVERHFTEKEAEELSRLRQRRYYELKGLRGYAKGMLKERQELWEDFNKEATSKGWVNGKRDKEWLRLVDDWYIAENYLPQVVKIGGWKFSSYKDKKHWLKKRVWLWFDRVSKQLPEEYRYSNDQSSLRKKGPGLHGRYIKALQAAERAQNKAKVASLKRVALRRPELDEQLTEEAQRSGFRGKSVYLTALAEKRKGAR